MPSNTLTLYYQPWKKLLTLPGLILAASLVWIGLNSHVYLIEVSLVIFASCLCLRMLDILQTKTIELYPDKIIKNGYFLQSLVPAERLQVAQHPHQQTITLFHASRQNLPEAITLQLWFLPQELTVWLNSYLLQTYRISSYTQQGRQEKTAACSQFEQAATTFNFSTLIALAYLLLYIIVASYIADEYASFNGYAIDFPELPTRLLGFTLAGLCYPLLKALSKPLAIGNATYSEHLQRHQLRVMTIALLINVQIWLGLLLFLGFGNKLDFYAMLLLGYCFYNGFYPRLAQWEYIVAATSPAATVAPPVIQRRSMQVSLALLGGLSMAGYMTANPALRIAQPDCNPLANLNQPCQPNNPAFNNGVSSGGSGSSNGGRSFGTRWDSNRMTVSRGGFGGFGRFFSGFGG